MRFLTGCMAFLFTLSFVLFVAAMSDSELDPGSDGPGGCLDVEASTGSPDGVRRSSRLTAVSGSLSGEADRMSSRLRDRGVVAAPGVLSPELRELAALGDCLSPAPSVATPVASGRGRKRTKKADPPARAPAKRRAAAALSQPADTAVPGGSSDSGLILASLQSLAGSMQAMEARMRAVESMAGGGVSGTITTALASLSVPAVVGVQPVPSPSVEHCHSLATAVPSLSLGRPYIPVSANISSRLRSKILQGRDVNLVSLILPSPECDKSLVAGDGFSAVVKSADPRLNKDLSFGQFVVAFGIFRDVICSVYPDRRVELDSYLALVGDLFLRYGRNYFWQYHRAFSGKAAAHIARANVRLDWSILDTEILVMVVGGAQAILCSHCGAAGHVASLCPGGVGQPTGPAQSHRGGLRFPVSGVDARGRQVHTSNNNPICNNFNEGVCTYGNCCFLHICSDCRDAHPRSVCPRRPAPRRKPRGQPQTGSKTY